MPRISQQKTIQNESKCKNLIPSYSLLLEKLVSKYNVVRDGKYSDLVNFKTNQKLPIHRWFEYKQGYSALLVDTIIKEVEVSHEHYVLDPYTGVGTTNVVAQNNDFKSIGFDINPVATFAANVKTSIFTEEEINQIEKYIQNFSPSMSDIIPNSSLLDGSFSTRMFDQLMRIKGFYESIENKKIRSLFKLAYLSIVEDSSFRKKDGNGIKLVKNKPEILDVFSFFLEKCQIMLNDVKQKNSSEYVKIITGSITRQEDFQPIKDKKVGLVVFSPPYANCFDYCEVYKLELWMGEFVKTYRDFDRYRSMAVRSHVNSKFNHEITYNNDDVNIVANLISCFNIWNKNIPDMIKGYFDDLTKCFTILKKIMVPKSKCYIVVANSGYKGILVPTDLLLSEIAEKVGFIVPEIIYARKIRASSQQMNDIYDNYENLMRESVITLEQT